MRPLARRLASHRPSRLRKTWPPGHVVLAPASASCSVDPAAFVNLGRQAMSALPFAMLFGRRPSRLRKPLPLSPCQSSCPCHAFSAVDPVAFVNSAAPSACMRLALAMPLAVDPAAFVNPAPRLCRPCPSRGAVPSTPVAGVHALILHSSFSTFVSHFS